MILEINNGKIESVELKLIDYDINIIREKISKSKILEEDKVLMNLSFCAISGKGSIRKEFLKEAKKIMFEKNGRLSVENAKGIYKYMKLYDDDIWLGLAEKYKEYFVFE